MDETVRLQARAFLLRARLYRFMALCFVAAGCGVFLLLYFKHIEGHFFEAFKKPTTVLMILLPFLPAFILTRLSVRAEKKFRAVLEDAGRQESGGAPAA